MIILAFFSLLSLSGECRVNYRQRNYAEVSTQLHGAVSVVDEFSKYRSIPQIKQLMDRWVGLGVCGPRGGTFNCVTAG